MKEKNIYYSKKLLKCTEDIKKTWNVMKDTIGKSKIKSPNLPRKLNPLSANPTEWSNTLKQFVGKLPTNCLSVFDREIGS